MRASYNYNFEKRNRWRWQRTEVTLRPIVKSLFENPLSLKQFKYSPEKFGSEFVSLRGSVVIPRRIGVQIGGYSS